MFTFWDQFKAYILGTRLFFPIDFILNLLQDTDEQLKNYKLLNQNSYARDFIYKKSPKQKYRVIFKNCA